MHHGLLFIERMKIISEFILGADIVENLNLFMKKLPKKFMIYLQQLKNYETFVLSELMQRFIRMLQIAMMFVVIRQSNLFVDHKPFPMTMNDQNRLF